MVDVVIVGSIAYDSIASQYAKTERLLGGAAVFAGLSASYFQKVGLVGVIGDDFAESDTALLERRGIDLRGVQKRAGQTLFWRASYENDINNADTLDIQLNVFADFQPAVPTEYQSAGALLLANISPKIQLAALDCMEQRPQLVACDTMNLWIETEREALTELLQRVDVIFINDAEARQYTGEDSLVGAGEALLALGAQYVVIKRGEYGSALFHRDFMFLAPAWPVREVYDPTGAGDSFAGGFVGALMRMGNAEPDSIRQAVIFGTSMASFTVAECGTTSLQSLSAEAIAKRQKQLYGVARFDEVTKF